MAECNEVECPCLKTTCPRHGKCCDCVMHHRAGPSIVACLRPVAEAQIAAAVEAAGK